jgi:hypothetical protein
MVPAPPRKKTEPAATVALILAVVGIFTWGMSSVVALFLAPRAKRNIEAAPEYRKGKELAVTAQVLGVLSLLFIVGVTVALYKA